VDDVNDFHMACLADPRTDGGTFNVGSGTNHSVLEIYEEIAELLGTRIPPEHRPDTAGDEAEETLADISAAKAAGWVPRVPLKDGLKRSIAFIRENVLPAAS